MSLIAIVNEASIAAVDHKSEAIAVFVQFVETLQAVKAHRSEVTLFSPEGLRHIELLKGTPLAALTARGKLREQWRYLLNLRQRVPFSAIPHHVRSTDESNREYFYHELRVEGLGFAADVDGLGVSFATLSLWDEARLTLRKSMLTELDDGTVDLLNTEVVVSHVSCKEHVLRLVELSELGRKSIVSGAELWARRAELFERLDFLPRVEKQLGDLDRAGTGVAEVFNHLRALDRDACKWVGQTSMPEWSIKVVPEHQTRKMIAYFEDLDGTQQLFDLHIRFAPKPGRIHLRVLPESRRIRVAHIGRKLGT